MHDWNTCGVDKSWFDSNVVDIFHKVKTLPLKGEKGFFQNSMEPVSGTIVGGVTLNHLVWARLLGAPTSLFVLSNDSSPQHTLCKHRMALQCPGENGQMIRSKLDSFGVGTDAIDVNSDHITSLSHVFVDSFGERSIIMSKGSTSQINSQCVQRHFKHHIEDPSTAILTTEISQVPLSGRYIYVLCDIIVDTFGFGTLNRRV